MNGPSVAENAAQITYWNEGAGPRWARNQAHLDRAFAGMTAALLAHAQPQPGERVVDIGCGCGDLALAAASKVGPAGDVTGVDISQPMLAQARTRDAASAGPTRAPVAWAEADATTYAFDGDADLVVSRYGVMFFADPVAAFANIRSALKPGGRLAMMCWAPLAQNDWAALPLEAAVPILGAPEPTPPFTPGPFAFADSARTLSILAAAGFEDGVAASVPGKLHIGKGPDQEAALADALVFCREAGPVAVLLRDRPDDAREPALAAIGAKLRPFATEGSVEVGCTCWIYTARRPA